MPYLARSKQSERLRAFSERHYPAAKNDLATVFLERCLKLCADSGTASLVLPQNWLFLTRYQRLREKLLKSETWCLLARLGPGAFETISGEVVKAILLTLNHKNPASDRIRQSTKLDVTDSIYGIDISDSRTVAEKAARLIEAEGKIIKQAQQMLNPDARILFQVNENSEWLFEIADYSRGICTGDDLCFVRSFWELETLNNAQWDLQHSTTAETSKFSGQHRVLRWDNGNESLMDIVSARLDGQVGQWIRGKKVWGQKGILVSPTGIIRCALYVGNYFDANSLVVKPREAKHLSALWAYCSSPKYHDDVREVDDALKVGDALVKVPFDLAYWIGEAKRRYPNGLPAPHTDDPTQWLFHGHPCGSVIWDEGTKWTTHGPLRTAPTVLQVAVARLLGYRWPAENDPDMELADEARAWVEKTTALHPFADEDGIVCIPSVAREHPAHERLLQLLQAAWGEDWSDDILAKLLTEAGTSSLDDWLRNRFFEEHCKLFHQRPFVWHIWDGRRRDGFHALVNYHKMVEGGGKGRRLLDSLTYSYLGDWISRQQDGVRRGEGGAEDRLAAAIELQKRLVAILAGEPPFDLFIRWKPIEEQPIGWEPDINDGVRLNIRPFMAEDLPGGKKGAGVLRAAPNIHWKKDRGKEPMRNKDQFPWFWNNGSFTGDRVNNVHWTKADKYAAQDRAEDE